MLPQSRGRSRLGACQWAGRERSEARMDRVSAVGTVRKTFMGKLCRAVDVRDAFVEGCSLQCAPTWVYVPVEIGEVKGTPQSFRKKVGLFEKFCKYCVKFNTVFYCIGLRGSRRLKMWWIWGHWPGIRDFWKYFATIFLNKSEICLFHFVHDPAWWTLTHLFCPFFEGLLTKCESLSLTVSGLTKVWLACFDSIFLSPYGAGPSKKADNRLLCLKPVCVCVSNQVHSEPLASTHLRTADAQAAMT